MKVPVTDLVIGDCIKGFGVVTRDVEDHDTRDGYVVLVTEKDGEERLDVVPAELEVQIRVTDERAA